MWHLLSAGRATPLSQQPAASLQQADVGDPNSAAALPALTAPQRVPVAGPLGLKSPFAAVQQALAAKAASNGKDIPPDDGASHTVPPHSSHETSPSPQAPITAGPRIVAGCCPTRLRKCRVGEADQADQHCLLW